MVVSKGILCFLLRIVKGGYQFRRVVHFYHVIIRNCRMVCEEKERSKFLVLKKPGEPAHYESGDVRRHVK